MRGKKFLEGVWLGRGEEKKGRAQVFSSWAHQKVFFPKWGEIVGEFDLLI